MAGIYTRTVHAMAMPFVVAIGATTDATAADLDDAVARVHHDLQWADATFSLWIPDSPLSRLVRGEVQADDLPPAVGEVLAECERFRIETGGAFDARRPDGTIDPTGIVKMWAVERASRHLDALPTTGWMIGAAGDVLASGYAEAGEPWSVGVADPRRADDPQHAPVLDVVALAGGSALTSICTSGTAQQGEHLWNRDGEMKAAYLQATVAGPDPVACDAWATAIAAQGADAALAAQSHGLEILCIADASGDGDVQAVASPGWPTALPGAAV